MISFPDKLCDNRSFTSESTSPKIQSHKSLAPELPEWCNPCSSRSLADDDAGDRVVAGSVTVTRVS